MVGPQGPQRSSLQAKPKLPTDTLILLSLILEKQNYQVATVKWPSSHMHVLTDIEQTLGVQNC